MTLAKDDMDALCTTEHGFAGYRVSGGSVITPPQAALGHLRSLHNYMGRLAETTPEALTDTKLARDLEHSLMAAMRGFCARTQRGPPKLSANGTMNSLYSGSARWSRRILAARCECRR